VLSLIALIVLFTLVVRAHLHGQSWLMAMLTGFRRSLEGLFATAGLLLVLAVGIGTIRAILHPVADAALSLFPEGHPAASHARRVPEAPPTEMPVLATLPRLIPTPRAEVALIPQSYTMVMPTSLPVESEKASKPTSPAASLPTRIPSPAISAPTATPAAARAGCDPAYPDAGTCIPLGPPFDQGCAVTDARRFTVLPPDPQGLDHDSDGIGCEPVA
jgi:hypothetical protein